MTRYTGRGKRRSRVLPVLTLAAQERRPAGNVELRDYIFRSILRYQKEKQRHERT